jgi:hypothetical protein
VSAGRHVLNHNLKAVFERNRVAFGWKLVENRVRPDA